MPCREEGGVTARIYIGVLDEHLPIVLGYDSIFMQGNTPIHEAHAVAKWLKDMGIEVVDWPPILLISTLLKIHGKC